MPARPGLSREKVVAAAIELMREEGQEGLSLARLAQHLSVKPPSLYNHIEGSEGLRRSVRTAGVTRLGSELQKAAVGRSGADALLEVARCYREFAHANPALYALTLEGDTGDDLELTAAAGGVLEVLQAVLRGYGLEGEESVHAIRVLRSALHGFVALELARGFAMAVDVDESFARLVRLLDEGLRSVK